jgi:hypothetical protein
VITPLRGLANGLCLTCVLLLCSLQAGIMHNERHPASAPQRKPPDGHQPPRVMTNKREFEVALQWLLGCACIFSPGHSHAFGHANAHCFGLASLDRRENNGIRGSQIFWEEVDQDAVGSYSSRVNRRYILVLADLPPSKTGPEAQHRHRLLIHSHPEYLRNGYSKRRNQCHGSRQGKVVS